MSWTCLGTRNEHGVHRAAAAGDLAAVACVQAQYSPERRAAKARDPPVWGPLLERLLQEAEEARPEPAESSGAAISKSRPSEARSSGKGNFQPWSPARPSSMPSRESCSWESRAQRLVKTALHQFVGVLWQRAMAFPVAASLSLDGVDISSEGRSASLELGGSKVLDTLRQLAKIRVRGIGGEILRADSLWQDRPALLLLLRRPGCVTCRAESLKLEQIADRLDQLGIRRIAIVHEWLELEIKAYLKEFWTGELFHDPGREFFKVLGGGEIKHCRLVDLKPRSRMWKNITTAKLIMKGHASNLKGEFMTLGGLIVIKPGTLGVQYMFREEVAGDPLHIKQILDECTAAAKPEGAPPTAERADNSNQAQSRSYSLPAVPLTKFRWERDGGKATPPPSAEAVTHDSAADPPVADALEKIADARAQAKRVPSFDWTNPSFRVNTRKSRSTGSESISGSPTPLMSIERDISRAAILKPYLAAQALAGPQGAVLAQELHSRLCESISELGEARLHKDGKD